jgi:hypothetical protein
MKWLWYTSLSRLGSSLGPAGLFLIKKSETTESETIYRLGHINF